MQNHGDFWDPIFDWLGLDGASVIATLVMISMVCNFIYRLIPDDAEGWLGKVKPIFKVLGLYASNRVTSGVTVNDVARELARVKVDEASERIEEVAERVDERIEEAVTHIPVAPAFPGLRNREQDSEGRIRPLISIFTLMLLIPLLIMGCTTIAAGAVKAASAISQVCSSRDEIAYLISLVEKDPNHPKASALLAAADVTCPLVVQQARES